MLLRKSAQTGETEHTALTQHFEMTRHFYGDLFKGFLLGVICSLATVYTVGQNGSGFLTTGKLDRLVNTARFSCECVGPPEINEEENTQEVAISDIEEHERRLSDERSRQCLEEFGTPCPGAARLINLGACYDLAWWAAHKKCRRGSCWNLSHGFCERC